MPQTNSNEFLFYIWNSQPCLTQGGAIKKDICAFDMVLICRWIGHGDWLTSWSLKPVAQIHRAWKIYFTRLSGPVLSVLPVLKDRNRGIKQRGIQDDEASLVQDICSKCWSTGFSKTTLSMWKRNKNTNPFGYVAWKWLIFARSSIEINT